VATKLPCILDGCSFQAASERDLLNHLNGSHFAADSSAEELTIRQDATTSPPGSGETGDTEQPMAASPVDPPAQVIGRHDTHHDARNVVADDGRKPAQLSTRSRASQPTTKPKPAAGQQCVAYCLCCARGKLSIDAFGSYSDLGALYFSLYRASLHTFFGGEDTTVPPIFVHDWSCQNQNGHGAITEFFAKKPLRRDYEQEFWWRSEAKLCILVGAGPNDPVCAPTMYWAGVRVAVLAIPRIHIR
jgi:hypothetical protein